MARNAVVGIVVSAVDKASVVLKGVGAAAGATSQAVQKMASAGDRAMKALGQGVIEFDHALALGHKAFRMFDAVIGETVRSAINFRDVHDAAAHQMQAFERNVELARARLGDAFIPVLASVSKSLTPMLKSLQQWAVENQKIIAGGLIEWGEKAAIVLTKGIALGVIGISRAWAGWNEIIAVVSGGIKEFFSAVISGSGSLLQTLGDVAGALHLPGVQQSLEGVGATMKGLGAEFSVSAQRNWQELDETIAKQDALEAKVNGVSGAVERGIGKIAVKAMKDLQTATVGTNQSLEDQQRISEQLAQHEQRRAAVVRKTETDIAAIEEANAQRRLEANAKFEQEEQQRMQKMQGIATSIGEAWGGAMQSIVDGSETAEHAILKAVLSSIKTIVMATAVEAAAKAFAANQEFPIVGVALGLAAASAAFGIAQSWLAKVPGAEMGELPIRGGVANRDSVLRMVMPGESIRTKEQTRLDRMGAGAGKTDIHLHANWHSVAQPTEADAKNFIIKNMKRVLEDLVRNGYLRLQPR